MEQGPEKIEPGSSKILMQDKIMGFGLNDPTDMDSANSLQVAVFDGKTHETHYMMISAHAFAELYRNIDVIASMLSLKIKAD